MDIFATHFPFLFLLVIFLAVFTQTLSGFGVALVSMALLPGIIGIRVASPLVALVSLVLEAFLLWRYYEALSLKAVWRLALASLAGIPIGIWLLNRADERIVLGLLGVVIVGYALYALLQLRLPGLSAPVWAYLSGFLSGMLSGAYNTGGPPVILYGDCRRWLPGEFKGNLQGFFLFNSTFVLISHAVSGNLTLTVWQNFLWALPALAVGIISGISLERYLDPAAFRKVVLVLLVVMGLRMILSVV